MTLFYLIVAWLFGIALARVANIAWWLWLLLFAPALIGFLLTRRLGDQNGRRASWSLIFGCAALFALGAARLAFSIPHFDADDLAIYNDQGFVTIEGLIIDAPDVRDTHVNLRVRAESITLPDDETRPIKGLALVQAPLAGSYRYGDPVTVRGELHTPPEFDTFSYREYLARQNVHSLLRYAQVEVTGERRGNPARAALLDFRATAHEVIIRLLPDPQASLLAGILLGIEGGISPDVLEAFNAVGATHVIAISGSNLVILAGVLQNVARRFVREAWAAVITILGVLLYTVFVGGDAAVVRAAIMTTLTLVAARLGRQTYGFASLSFAALVMTAINPFTLWDVGFQLSALATLGLILYVDPLQTLLAKGLSAFLSAETARKVVGALSEAFVVTVAAQITTTPIIAYYFGRLSLLSLPVNLLIIPLQTPLMVLGGLGVLTALIIWPVGQALAWGSWLFLTCTIAVVRFFAHLPFASLGAENLSPLTIWGIYAIMFGLTFYAIQPADQRTRWRELLGRALGVKALASAGLITATLLVAATCSLPNDRLHVTFIDVGPGTATLIETPSGRHILVDAGGSARKLSTALGDELPFWDRRLDLVILTQPTQAHTGALLPILRRYHVDAVMTNGLRGTGDLDDMLWAALEAGGTQTVTAQPGTRVSVGDGVTLTVLQTQTGPPPEAGDPGQPVVLLLTYRDARILLTGDLTPEGEAALLSAGLPLGSTVLQVPAGGSRTVGSEAFLVAVNPQINVLSIDAGNRYGLPHPEALARLAATGAPLYRTDQAGTIRLTTDGHRLWVKTARRSEP